MKKRLIRLSCVLFFGFFLPLRAVSNQHVQNFMLQDLEAAKYNILVKYAPVEWKNEYFGWNLENAFEKSKERILQENPQTSRDYQKIFSEFFASMKDYHVHSIYYSTSWSMFPIKIAGAKGKYFYNGFNSDMSLGSDDVSLLAINDNNMEMISRSFSDVLVGDEILAIDGQPIQELIEQLIDENFYGDRSPTGYALARRNVFLRRGKLGQAVPSGTFELTLLHKGDKKPFTITLPWIHAPEWIFNHVIKDLPEREFNVSNMDGFTTLAQTGSPIDTANRLLSKDFSVGIANEMAIEHIFRQLSKHKKSSRKKPDKPQKKIEDLRDKGALPVLGKLVWESGYDNEIYAYLYQQSERCVGYLYLSTFDHFGPDADAIIDEMISILRVFNQRADALVIDITNNTGGNMMFMYAVLSLLSDTPLKVPSHRELLIQEDIFKAALLYNSLKGYKTSKNQIKEFSETLSGYPIRDGMIEQIIDYAFILMKTWESGSRLTSHLYLFGIDEILPHPKLQFKKPIIVLTNEFDFSCADFFPAILQDNKRAKIFGMKTAGAGGYVKSYPLNSRFGVQAITLTASIAYRPDGTPIENLGVTPDLIYEPTINDARNNFVDYIRRLNLEVRKLIK